MIKTPKITNNPAKNNFSSVLVKDHFLIRDNIPVISVKKITNRTLSISVWYLIISLYLSFMIREYNQKYCGQVKLKDVDNPFIMW